ncbi:MAG TPA: hypothetical protein VNN62_02735 [Methylomirabilota bacterium]|nr:hypothetical protein [Methylomirabilota bacterium]
MKIQPFTNPQLLFQSVSGRSAATAPRVSKPGFTDHLSLTTKDSRVLSASYRLLGQPITQPASYGKVTPLPADNFTGSQPPSDGTRISPIGIVPQPTPPEEEASLVATYTPSAAEIKSAEDYWTLERMQQAKPMPIPAVLLPNDLIPSEDGLLAEGSNGAPQYNVQEGEAPNWES